MSHDQPPGGIESPGTTRRTCGIYRPERDEAAEEDARGQGDEGIAPQEGLWARLVRWIAEG